MKKKILSFVFDGKKFLALKSEPHPEHGEGGWFTVTGAVEPGESHEDAVRREVKEETGLDTKDIFNLNWGSTYNWKGETCEELNFISFVEPGKIILNEEHSEYEWLNLDGFVSKIKWSADKSELKQVLETGIKKKLIFNKLKLHKA